MLALNMLCMIRCDDIGGGGGYKHRLKTQTDNVNDGNEISLVSGIVGWQH